MGTKLTGTNDPAIGVRMGRPPLNVRETKVYLTEEQIERVKALVGTYGMSKFIREAVDNELQRREAQAASAATE